MKKEPLEIIPGKTYHNGGQRKRTVVGFSGYMVLYKTSSARGTTSGVPIWDFQKWAKGVVGEGETA